MELSQLCHVLNFSTLWSFHFQLFIRLSCHFPLFRHLENEWKRNGGQLSNPQHEGWSRWRLCLLRLDLSSLPFNANLPNNFSQHFYKFGFILGVDNITNDLLHSNHNDLLLIVLVHLDQNWTNQLKQLDWVKNRV